MKWLIAVLALLLPLASATAQTPDSLDRVAEDYVRLTLEIGERDPGYVDAYYGPAEWRAAARAAPRDLEALAAAVATLRQRLEASPAGAGADAQRKAFLRAQLVAAATRLRIARGERLSFEDEAESLYGIRPHLRPLTDYDAVLAQIDRLVPGEGPLAARVAAFQGRFLIPRDRLDRVMREAIAECRRRTIAHIALPAEERFDLELVTNRSWSGYNWYQGGFHSLIQINTDLPMRMGRVLDIGCHEGYPGHHVYNMLLERDLARGRNWVEYQVYPLYSPQSFIAEGSANYGVELAFPGEERLRYETRTLYPLAGLSAADAARYLALDTAIERLGGAQFTIARDYLEGRIPRERAVALMQHYLLSGPERAAQQIAFMDQYRAYVINYGLGREMVAAYIERRAATPEARWAEMRRLLSEPVLPSDLLPAAP